MVDQNTDSLSKQFDKDNKSELDRTSDDNDWCLVTKLDGNVIRFLKLPLSVQNPSQPRNILVI